MNTVVFVVSDLHLGGPEGFQMCSPTGQDRLAAFFRWVGAQSGAAQEIRLVLAGDVVDFLAEPDDAKRPREEWTWSAFCNDEALALDKLERILGRTAPVWDALASFVAASGTLTLLLGNHDVELALPRVRRRLLERVAPKGGRVTFLYDDEAFALGRLLVEHGNRYEGWNVVAHDSLRRIRSRLSRREKPDPFPTQPGSSVVANVMNPIKRKYAFVDLLKPETAGVVPILAALDRGLWKRVGPGIGDAARAAWRQSQFGPDGKPTEGEFIRAGAPAAPPARGAELMGASLPRSAPPPPAAPPTAPFPDEDALALADELARGPREERVGVFEDLQIEVLLRAFRWRKDKDQATFAVDREAELYLRPAKALAADGFDVVVFGHTHHAKRVDLPSGRTYLNTGTWADLMRLPDAIYAGSTSDGVAALKAFLDAVRGNRIEEYRRQLPTYARIDLGAAGEVLAQGVFFFDGGGPPVPVSTGEVLSRLGRTAP